MKSILKRLSSDQKDELGEFVFNSFALRDLARREIWSAIKVHELDDGGSRVDHSTVVLDSDWLVDDLVFVPGVRVRRLA